MMNERKAFPLTERAVRTNFEVRYRLHFLDTLTPEDKEQTGAALGKHSLTKRRKENFPEAG